MDCVTVNLCYKDVLLLMKEKDDIVASCFNLFVSKCAVRVQAVVTLPTSSKYAV